MIRSLLYYLFKVRGASLRDEMRLLAGMLRLSVRYIVSIIGFGEPYRGLWAAIPGRKTLTVKVEDLVFRARPRTTDLSFATWFIDGIEGYELRNWFYPYARGVVIDVGANVGGYTVRACRRADIVVAIEPQPEVFEILRDNVELNCPGNVVLIRKAVADRPGTMVLRIPRDAAIGSGGASILSDYEPFPGAKELIKGYQEVEVEVDTLDNILGGLGIDRVDFLKVDVEGAEKLVVRGGMNILRRTSRVMIEIKPGNEDVLDILDRLGFEVIDRKGENHFLARRSI